MEWLGQEVYMRRKISSVPGNYGLLGMIEDLESVSG